MSLDWEHISASDIFVLFNSFCKSHKNSRVERVEIYPSDFGIQEMEKEKINGPDAEIFNNEGGNEDEEEVIHDLDELIDDEKKDEYRGFDQVKLRKYELKKLKYYYAVVYCDSKETGLMLYNECDGMEFEKTGCFMDLRFIPDSLESFPHKPKEVCTEEPKDYNPEFKTNRAVQNTKVKLTWDCNDEKRDELLNKAFKKEQFKYEEIQQLLVSSDSEDDEDAKEFQALLDSVDESKGLQLLNRKKNKDLNLKDGETITITFNKGFEGINTNEKDTTKKDRSTYHEYLDKKKNIRRQKKEEEKRKREDKKSKRKGIDSNPANKKELSLLVDKSIKEKKFRPDEKDSRFNARFENTAFAIDPTSKDYKKNKK